MDGLAVGNPSEGFPIPCRPASLATRDCGIPAPASIGRFQKEPTVFLQHREWERKIPFPFLFLGIPLIRGLHAFQLKGRDIILLRAGKFLYKAFQGQGK